MNYHMSSSQIRHHECDADGFLKLHSLFDHLQNAAAEHASLLSVGMDELAELQLIWVLSRMKFTLDRPVKLGEILDIKTYPCGLERIFAHRSYDLLIDSKRVGCAGSLWLPVSVANNRPVNAKKILPENMLGSPDLEVFFTGLDKLPDFSGVLCGEYLVGAGDIDLNNHLNNAVYARWCADALGKMLDKNAVWVGEMQVNYLSSCFRGEKVNVFFGTADDSRFLIYAEKDSGEKVFQAAGTYCL